MGARGRWNGNGNGNGMHARRTKTHKAATRNRHGRIGTEVSDLMAALKGSHGNACTSQTSPITSTLGHKYKYGRIHFSDAVGILEPPSSSCTQPHPLTPPHPQNRNKYNAPITARNNTPHSPQEQVERVPRTPRPIFHISQIQPDLNVSSPRVSETRVR